MANMTINEIKKKAIRVVEPDYSYITGSYLRKFRMEMKMSQTLLADYLGVSKKAIEKWEQGKNKINPVVVRMIYLIEKDNKILSMLKDVRVNEEAYNKEFSSEFVVSDNQVETPRVGIEENYKVYNGDWDATNTKNRVGAFAYGETGL